MDKDFEIFKLESSIPTLTARSYWAGASSAFDVALNCAARFLTEKDIGNLDECDKHEFDGMMLVVKDLMSFMTSCRNEHTKEIERFVTELEEHVNGVNAGYVTLDEEDVESAGKEQQDV